MAAIKLTVDRIQPGLHIRLPLKWNDHPFLLNSFKIKDQEQIEMIRHLGVKFVYFNPEQSDAAPLPVNQIQTDSTTSNESLDLETQKLWQEKQKRIEKLSAYRRRVIQCEKEFERSLARMRSVMTKIRNRPTAAVDEAQLLIEDIVEKLMCDDNVTLHLMNGKNEFEDIYFHSLNVAVIAMMIGRAKGYSAKQLKELSFAALFHDMGKIKIPTAILRKQVPLTEPETNYLKLHTKYGLDLANQIEGFPESAKTVIAQHHELRDGSGYPEGHKGDEIDELAQIVIVANAFDNLCHTPIASEQKIPYTALSHLYKNCKHLYKEENLNILIKFMGVFPPGTVVQLSNNMVGLVISVNASNLLFPNVLVYDPSVPRTQAPIIELASKDLRIVNAIHPSKLPDKIKEYLNPRSRISYFFDSDE
ncbi:HD-GYP domain-containing protein [Vibrio parahaemolyticus]|uniref:HD-GYP domain-containing protein n=1 Tax=Vibrio parahaemolyticus TaxID=670 RepID=UPI0004DA9813|nr:HD-GYP domain-containing protein [Vibrio parahaemolyticus]EJG0875120.1 HD-GYP domain-containing protein [Vibrio parahaemolyticus O3]EJG0903748.1 HD-GYP domain-containing protein [Vibrio parahaemolyticus O3:K56]EJG1076104.1 HD-GYP domain-containing protein [Vibrio parahaemolyticus O1:K56]ANQ55087.1 HD family phosphohydrolase [Vibrio parahaemolyticus]ASO14917.1 HD-GYP domain-containing protein [Vibrio parahaemolyticus]